VSRPHVTVVSMHATYGIPRSTGFLRIIRIQHVVLSSYVSTTNDEDEQVYRKSKEMSLTKKTRTRTYASGLYGRHLGSRWGPLAGRGTLDISKSDDEPSVSMTFVVSDIIAPHFL